MKTLLASLWGVLLLSVTLNAADVSGKWSGTFAFKDDRGEAKSKPAFMILKQDGNKLTGSGGPNESNQYTIQNGKVDGDKLTFEVETGSMTMSFDLTVKGDQISGDMKGNENGTQRTVKLSLKRVVEK